MDGSNKIIIPRRTGFTWIANTYLWFTLWSRSYFEKSRKNCVEGWCTTKTFVWFSYFLFYTNFKEKKIYIFIFITRNTCTLHFDESSMSFNPSESNMPSATSKKTHLKFNIIQKSFHIWYKNNSICFSHKHLIGLE